jgi:5-(carboxyamino)imidazole ribonucleotide synthase
MNKDKTYFSSDFTLGILGGGQLGKMLLTKTQQWDIRTNILDPSAEAPSRIGCNHFEQGSLTDFDTVYQFGKKADVLTIEIENVNVEALQKLQEEGVKVYPKPDTLSIIKNKSRQKEFYRQHGIPTSDFFTFSNKAEMLERIESGAMQSPFVWKSAEGGYDGKGVQIVRNESDLENLPDVPGLIENLVPFDKEIAIIVARSPSGETKCFPMVEMDFHPTANLVEYVFSPSELTAEKQALAEEIALNVANKLDHVGLLAVEMFVYGEFGILVNEVAPRVHNSGHLTIEGNVCSQFEQHLRAILDMPLGDTSIIRPAVMINLNGEEGFEGPVYYEGMDDVLKMESVYVHLYGKAETRPFRKMGHVTILDSTSKAARMKAKLVKSSLFVKSK